MTGSMSHSSAKHMSNSKQTKKEFMYKTQKNDPSPTPYPPASYRQNTDTDLWTPSKL